MLGMVQEQGLPVSSLLTHAQRNHRDAEIVSRTSEGPLHRTTYGASCQRPAPARRLATLAWHGYRHMELIAGESGHLLVKGPWIAAAYFPGEGGPLFDLENAAVGHPAVAGAAVIGMPHPK